MKAIIFDTETTDLLPNSVIAAKHRPHVIEFYAAKLELIDDTWIKIDELEFFCRPPFRVSEEVTRITGITEDMLKDAAPWGDHASRVSDFFVDADLVVAHNLSYDMAVVDTEMERLETTMDWPESRVCTVEATEHLKGHRLNLNALHEELFGEGFRGAHRARVDVGALSKCFIALWERNEI